MLRPSCPHLNECPEEYISGFPGFELEILIKASLYLRAIIFFGTIFANVKELLNIYLKNRDLKNDHV